MRASLRSCSPHTRSSAQHSSPPQSRVTAHAKSFATTSSNSISVGYSMDQSLSRGVTTASRTLCNPSASVEVCRPPLLSQTWTSCVSTAPWWDAATPYVTAATTCITSTSSRRPIASSRANRANGFSSQTIRTTSGPGTSNPCVATHHRLTTTRASSAIACGWTASSARSVATSTGSSGTPQTRTPASNFSGASSTRAISTVAPFVRRCMPTWCIASKRSDDIHCHHRASISGWNTSSRERDACIAKAWAGGVQ